MDWEDLHATASNSNEPALAYEWSVKLSPTAADPLVLQSFENSEQKQPAKVETDTPVQKSAPHAPGEGSWSYDGSTFTFTWDGHETHFLYETPSSAFISTKVRKGTSLFDGVKQGNTFVGEMSYMANNDCSLLIGVPTRGELSDDYTRVTFHTKRPFLNAECNIVREQDDVVTLVFTSK